jgi:glucose-specific phosphotransferase system IIA component
MNNKYIYSPVNGKAVDIKNVNDPTFADEIMGKGVAFELIDGKIFAPANGTIESIFETSHAFVIKTDYGAEILIHIGLDTVKLKGEGFKAFVKTGDKVKYGDLLVEIDLEFIKSKNYDLITPLVVLNHSNFDKFEIYTGNVKVGDKIITL